MNHNESPFSNPDDRLDALLKKRVAKPSANFTASTLARIREGSDVSDAFIDRMLARRPMVPSTHFTARTVRVATRQNIIVSFFRPALAAAASVAVSFAGIWVYETASYGGQEPETAVAASAGEMAEIKELAAALSEAAPLLDPKAADTLALVSGQ